MGLSPDNETRYRPQVRSLPQNELLGRSGGHKPEIVFQVQAKDDKNKPYVWPLPNTPGADLVRRSIKNNNKKLEKQIKKKKGK